MTETGAKQQNRFTSPIWNYFTRQDFLNAICNLCQKTLSYRSSTTNLKSHLRNIHRSAYVEVCAAIKESMRKEPKDSNTIQTSEVLKQEVLYVDPAKDLMHDYVEPAKDLMHDYVEENSTEFVVTNVSEEKASNLSVTSQTKQEKSHKKDAVLIEAAKRLLKGYNEENSEVDLNHEKEPKQKRIRRSKTYQPNHYHNKEVVLIDTSKRLYKDHSEDNSADAFGRSVSSQLKELPTLQRCLAEKIIGEDYESNCERTQAMESTFSFLKFPRNVFKVNMIVLPITSTCKTRDDTDVLGALKRNSKLRR